MNIGIYIQLNIVSCVLCLLLIHQQKKHKTFDFLGSTEFSVILWLAVITMFLDIVAWLMLGGILNHTDKQLMTVLSIYYFMQSLLPLFFLRYCINTNGKELNYLTESALYIPVLATLVVLMLNFDQSLAFCIEGGRLKREAWFSLAVFAPLLYIIVCMVVNTGFYVKASDENKKFSLHLLICTLVSFAGAVLSAFVSSVNPWHIFVFSLIYLYMQMHGDQERHLDSIASQDTLTGFKNYAAYTAVISELNESIEQGDDPKFSVVMMDVNGLKKINDTYGHEAGNELILGGAKLMDIAFSDCDIYRIGGDEFVVILRDECYSNRKERFEMFTSLMEDATFSASGIELPVTVAAGIADYDKELHSTYEDVFHCADAYMYQNKDACKARQRAQLNNV